MATKDDITLSKGGKTFTLWTVQDAENFQNKLVVKPAVITPKNQEDGAKPSMVVDLLMITHTFHFEGFIYHTTAKTALSKKQDLISIMEGARVNSTPIVLTYEGSTYNVFLEDLVIKGILNDDAVAQGYTGDDIAEYRVSLTVVEGKLVGS